jgi:hypothetical protein
VLETATDHERTILSMPESLGPASLSADGKRIAFTAGSNLWDLVEISIPNGIVSTMLAQGGMSMWPHLGPVRLALLVFNGRVGANRDRGPLRKGGVYPCAAFDRVRGSSAIRHFPGRTALGSGWPAIRVPNWFRWRHESPSLGFEHVG